MAQTRKGSAVEAAVNIAIGFAINWTANMVFLPMFGFSSLTAGKAFGIGLVFTVISMLRQYVLRRWFNGLRFGNEPEQAARAAAKREARDNYRAGVATGWMRGE